MKNKILSDIEIEHLFKSDMLHYEVFCSNNKYDTDTMYRACNRLKKGAKSAKLLYYTSVALVICTTLFLITTLISIVL